MVRARSCISDMGAWVHDIDVWVFDLDDTLYDARTDIFPQIDARMTGYMSGMLGLSWDRANMLRKQYWTEFGATLHGLRQVHGLCPVIFTKNTHDIDYSSLMPCGRTNQFLQKLPGQKIIFTNGPRGHAAKVLEQRGMSNIFADIFTIEDTGFRPKPDPHGYEQILRHLDVPASRVAMFEDSEQNLATAKALGLKTLHVGPTSLHDWDRRDDQLTGHLAWLHLQLDAGAHAPHDIGV